MPIDKQGLAWGILLSAFVSGFYDMFKSFLEGKWNEGIVAGIATLIILGILRVAFGSLLFPKEKK